MNKLVFCMLTVLFPSCASLPSVKGIYNATLIKNITSLLDTLLDDYDKNFRPGHGVKPLNISVSLSIRSFGAISEKDMDYSVNCYFRQKWIDERLAFGGSAVTTLPLTPNFLSKIWRPDTYIMNGRGSHLHKLTMPNILLRVSKDGTVYVSQRLTIKATCPMHLFKFPMDMQACPLEIGSLGYSNKHIQYEWVKPEGVTIEMETEEERLADDSPLAQYRRPKVIISTTNKTSIRTDDPDESSVLQAHFILQRQMGYYMLQVYLPCTLIVVMSWVSFWINKEASPARVALGVMTVLNMSTVGMGNRNHLPKVSYSTALDTYFFACFGFVFLALVEYAVINFANIVYLRHTKVNIARMQPYPVKSWVSRQVAVARIVGVMQQLRGMQNAEATTSTASALPPTSPWRRRGARDVQPAGLPRDNRAHSLRYLRREVHRMRAFAGQMMGAAPETMENDETANLTKTEEARNSIAVADKRTWRERLICRRRPKERDSMFVRMSKRAAKARETLTKKDPSKSVDKIDSAAKIFFPLTYVIFNVLYWTTYMYWLPNEIDTYPALIGKLEDIFV